MSDFVEAAENLDTGIRALAAVPLRPTEAVVGSPQLADMLDLPIGPDDLCHETRSGAWVREDAGRWRFWAGPGWEA